MDSSSFRPLQPQRSMQTGGPDAEHQAASSSSSSVKKRPRPPDPRFPSSTVHGSNLVQAGHDGLYDGRFLLPPDVEAAGATVLLQHPANATPAQQQRGLYGLERAAAAAPHHQQQFLVRTSNPNVQEPGAARNQVLVKGAGPRPPRGPAVGLDDVVKRYLERTSGGVATSSSSSSSCSSKTTSGKSKTNKAHGSAPAVIHQYDQEQLQQEAERRTVSVTSAKLQNLARELQGFEADFVARNLRREERRQSKNSDFDDGRAVVDPCSVASSHSSSPRGDDDEDAKIHVEETTAKDRAPVFRVGDENDPSAAQHAGGHQLHRLEPRKAKNYLAQVSSRLLGEPQYYDRDRSSSKSHGSSSPTGTSCSPSPTFRHTRHSRPRGQPFWMEATYEQELRKMMEVLGVEEEERESVAGGRDDGQTETSHDIDMKINEDGKNSAAAGLDAWSSPSPSTQLAKEHCRPEERNGACSETSDPDDHFYGSTKIKPRYRNVPVHWPASVREWIVKDLKVRQNTTMKVRKDLLDVEMETDEDADEGVDLEASSSASASRTRTRKETTKPKAKATAKAGASRSASAGSSHGRSSSAESRTRMNTRRKNKNENTKTKPLSSKHAVKPLPDKPRQQAFDARYFDRVEENFSRLDDLQQAFLDKEKEEQVREMAYREDGPFQGIWWTQEELDRKLALEMGIEIIGDEKAYAQREGQSSTRSSCTASPRRQMAGAANNPAQSVGTNKVPSFAAVASAGNTRPGTAAAAAAASRRGQLVPDHGTAKASNALSSSSTASVVSSGSASSTSRSVSSRIMNKKKHRPQLPTVTEEDEEMSDVAVKETAIFAPSSSSSSPVLTSAGP
ncbi:unnamed protein product, partial [Amoebophrya sp. A120]|eukprot:GSA120T00021774001.1